MHSIHYKGISIISKYFTYIFNGYAVPGTQKQRIRLLLTYVLLPLFDSMEKTPAFINVRRINGLN